jgi:hypothetical protein
MATLPCATTTRRWRASGSGKRDIGSSSSEGVPITSGDLFLVGESCGPGWVWIDWPCSALHLADLVQFRQMAAGVRETPSLILRSHYQQLSADPKSLANIDQGKLVSFLGECKLNDVDDLSQTC